MGRGKVNESKGIAPRTVRKALREARKQAKPIDRFGPVSKLRRKLDASQATIKGSRWPKLFREHLDNIQEHIKLLDRVVKNTNRLMGRMNEVEEREEREKWEKGGLLLLVGFKERAEVILEGALEAQKFVMGDPFMNGSKPFVGRGAGGQSQLSNISGQEQRTGVDARQQEESNSDVEMSDVSDASYSDLSNDEAQPPASFIPVDLSTKTSKHKVNGKEEDTNIQARGTAEPNPYFVVDTEPTPVAVNGKESTGIFKNSKKRAKQDEKGTPEKKVKKMKKDKVATPPLKPADPTLAQMREPVNFQALHAALQAEVEAGTRAQGGQGVTAAQVGEGSEGKEGKKGKKDRKKRRRSEVSERNGEDGEEVEERKRKKEKEEKEKKEKKRKAEDGEEDESPGSAKKKKRKHKEKVEV